MPESEHMNPDQPPLTELFSKPDCQACIATQRKLNEYGIPYIKWDVTVNEHARERVRDLGYSSLPVVLAPDGTSWTGLHLGKIKALRDE